MLFSNFDHDKEMAVPIAKEFEDLGFSIVATDGTCKVLKDHGIHAQRINKMQEGRPNIVDAVTAKEINLIINTPAGKQSAQDDSYIRKAAIKNKIPYMTTMAAAKATAAGIHSMKKGEGAPVKSLQEYHGSIK